MGFRIVLYGFTWLIGVLAIAAFTSKVLEPPTSITASALLGIIWGAVVVCTALEIEGP